MVSSLTAHYLLPTPYLAERGVVVVEVAESVTAERDERAARDRPSGDGQALEEERGLVVEAG